MPVIKQRAIVKWRRHRKHTKTVNKPLKMAFDYSRDAASPRCDRIYSMQKLRSGRIAILASAFQKILYLLIWESVCTPKFFKVYTVERICYISPKFKLFATLHELLQVKLLHYMNHSPCHLNISGRFSFSFPKNTNPGHWVDDVEKARTQNLNRQPIGK